MFFSKTNKTTNNVFFFLTYIKIWFVSSDCWIRIKNKKFNLVINESERVTKVYIIAASGPLSSESYVLFALVLWSRLTFCLDCSYTIKKVCGQLNIKERLGSSQLHFFLILRLLPVESEEGCNPFPRGMLYSCKNFLTSLVVFDLVEVLSFSFDAIVDPASFFDHIHEVLVWNDFCE